MNNYKLGLGRDFFSSFSPFSVHSISFKEKFDWILYYLQITGGFIVPDIEIFYDKPLVHNGYALYRKNEIQISGTTEMDENGFFDLFETLLFDLVRFLSNSLQVLFNEDAYEFWLEHPIFYKGSGVLPDSVSFQRCGDFLTLGASLSRRESVITGEQSRFSDSSFSTSKDFKKFIKGIFLLSDGKISEASDVFDKIPDNSNFIVYHFKGETAFVNGDIDSAAEILSLCMERCPYYSDVLYLSAASALSRGNPYRCCQVLKSARALYPEDAMLQFLLAKMYSYMDRDKTAAEIIEKIYEQEVEFPGLLLDHALVNFEDFPKAEANLLKALKMNKNHVPSLSTIASLYLKNNNTDRAEIYASRAVELAPLQAEHCCLFGRILHAAGKNEKAEEYFQQAASIDMYYIYELAVFYISCGENEKALPVLKTYLKLNPCNSKAHKYLKQITGSKEPHNVMPECFDDTLEDLEEDFY